MSQTEIPLPQMLPPPRSFGRTSRRDTWWLQPLLVLLGLSTFIIYSTWAAFQGAHYFVLDGGAHYLSPFYSPVLWDSGAPSGHAWFGPKPGWWPEWMLFSPALLILWAPGGFRFTCYYYRGAYYKSFWAAPASCSVGKPMKGYRGENSMPLILQNVHRYFLYLALAFIVILTWDAIRGFTFVNEAGNTSFGIGIGSLVLTMNVILLGGYTFGCHSLRHLIGGGLDILSGKPARKKCYDCVSCLNRKHMLFAWLSLFWVGFSDLYVRLCSMGVWTDWRLL